jgi:hypothetical protein
VRHMSHGFVDGEGVAPEIDEHREVGL